MNDTELLELAAKAAGLKIIKQKPEYSPPIYFHQVTDGDRQFSWSPLDSDGMALWLVVKLGLDLHPKGKGVEVWHFESRQSSGIVDYGDDPYAATRRAIVLAAAEIGKSIK